MTEYIRREDVFEDIEKLAKGGNCGGLYNDAEEAIAGTLEAVKIMVEQRSPARAVPARHGHWELTIDGDDKDGEFHVKAYCSECGASHMGMQGKPDGDILHIRFPEFVSREDAINAIAHAADKVVLWNYCPACGACMVNEENDAE